jgi:hypothetical protein
VDETEIEGPRRRIAAGLPICGPLLQIGTRQPANSEPDGARPRQSIHRPSVGLSVRLVGGAIATPKIEEPSHG